MIFELFFFLIKDTIKRWLLFYQITHGQNKWYTHNQNALRCISGLTRTSPICLIIRIPDILLTDFYQNAWRYFRVWYSTYQHKSIYINKCRCATRLSLLYRYIFMASPRGVLYIFIEHRSLGGTLNAAFKVPDMPQIVPILVQWTLLSGMLL